MSKIKISYAPNTFQVIKDPDDETKDYYVITNPNDMGGGIRAVVFKEEIDEELMDRFLEYLN